MSTANSTAPAKSSTVGARALGAVALGATNVSPVRTRRSRGWLAVAIALVLVGAIAGVFVYTSAGQTTQVLVTSHAVARGATIARGDLTAMSIAAGQTTTAIPVSDAANVIGKIAAADIAAGGLVTPNELTTTLPVPSGKALVGLELKPSQLPAQPLGAGDKIAIVPVAAQGAAVSQTPVDANNVINGIVSQVQQPNGSQNAGLVIVDVYVNKDQAADVTSRAAAGNVAIYLIAEH